MPERMVFVNLDPLVFVADFLADYTPPSYTFL
jgi:hypothetical protein